MRQFFSREFEWHHNIAWFFGQSRRRGACRERDWKFFGPWDWSDWKKLKRSPRRPPRWTGIRTRRNCVGAEFRPAIPVDYIKRKGGTLQIKPSHLRPVLKGNLRRKPSDSIGKTRKTSCCHESGFGGAIGQIRPAFVFFHTSGRWRYLRAAPIFIPNSTPPTSRAGL